MSPHPDAVRTFRGLLNALRIAVALDAAIVALIIWSLA